MTKRQYLTHPDQRVLVLGYAIDDGPVLATSPLRPDWAQVMETINTADVVVAHNATFDIACLTMLCHQPWPRRIHCTKELAQAWSPNQPGGYSLKNLASMWLGVDEQKLDIDFSTCTDEELATYCEQDVRVCRELHRIALSRLSPTELAVAEMTMASKEVHFLVDPTRAAAAFESFNTLSRAAATTLIEALGSDSPVGTEDGGDVRSIKPHELKRRLLEDFGFDAPTISLKKLNPEKLRSNPEAAKILHSAAEANKALSHRRRVRSTMGTPIVDCELTYYAAHTGRFSCKTSSGKGLNLQNLPKRNPAIAEPIRKMYRLPEDLCFVRADFSNVEYRIEGWLTDCDYVTRLFTDNIDADPYIAFWHAATGQLIDKKHPARQIAKAAVLGLGYGMGIMRWMEELARAIADPTFKVPLDALRGVCESMGWRPVSDPRAKAAQTKLRVDPAIATVAWETREMFHRLHYEFFKVARWLERSVSRLAATTQVERILDIIYDDPAAPPRERLELGVDEWMQGRTITVRCGPWPNPTVYWRDVAVRATPQGPGLSFCSGAKGFRRLTMNILIENVCQSAARNALCQAMLNLRERGHPYIINVHDEVMPVVPRTLGSALQARTDLLDVCGPNNDLGFDWAVVIKPEEITITESLWEDEKLCQALWQRIAQGDATALQELP